MSQSFTRYLRLLAAVCLTMVCTTRSEAISLSTNDLTHSMGNSNSTAGVLNVAGLRNTTLGAWRNIMPDSRFVGITIGSTQVNVSCYGTNSGRILLSPSGGTAPYTYSWSNGATTENLLNIVAGPYTVTVTDAAKNSASKLFTVTQPAEIIAFINCTPVCYGTCNGTASVTVSGGVSPYTYSWSTGSKSAAISGLCPATYWVTVTDGNGCLKIVGGTVCANPQIVITGTPTNPTCNGSSCDGSISVSASYKMTSSTCSNSKPCPFTYLWSNQMTGASISGLCAATYYVTVLDCIGCSATDTFTLVKPVLTATKSHTNVTCYGYDNGQACITVSTGTGPFTYSWSTGATSTGVSGTNCITVGAGIYGATVTEANGCSASIIDTVTQPTKLTLTKSVTPATCYGYDNGTACVSASGGTPAYTYSWNNGGTTSCITVGAGIYTGTVTDANGCSASVIDTVLQPTQLKLTKSTTPVTCYGYDNGTACVSASGGTPAYTYSWSNGGKTSCITVGAGIYDATVTDANGCSATVIDTVGTPTKLTLTKSTTPVTCYGYDNGTACVSASGGTPAYTYSWSNGGKTSCITVGAGIYTGTVTDANGCSATVIDTVGAPSKLTLTKSTTPVTCYGYDNGTACVSASGGTPAYTYSWSNGGKTSCITVGAGIYTGTVTDANGCTATVIDTVGTPTKLTLTKSTTPVTCYGYDNGTACVSASGGTPAYTYSWNNGGTTSCITVGAGIYDATVTDANGCTATVIDTVGTPTKLTLTKSTTPVTCYGYDNGTACVSASGGTPAYTYSWSNGGKTSCITVGAGIYTGTVTDANGCTATVIDTVGTPSKLTLTKTVTNILCYGGRGTACVTASGGTPAYTYTWSDGGTASCAKGKSTDLSGVTAGIYSVTVTDANGCTAVAIDTVTQPTQLTVTKSSTPVLCYGGTTGSACVSASGGTPSYTYSWSTGGRASCIQGVAAGVYGATVTDANGCSLAILDTVGTPTKLTVTKASTPVLCYGGTTGSACVTASGGTPAYTYSWSTGGSASCITDVAAGIYDATVTDANGCSVAIIDTVTQPTKLTLTKTVINILCYGGLGSACVTASGGTPAYTYSWNNGSTASCAQGNAITNLSGVLAGIYSVTVTDANGCTAVAIDTVLQPTKLTVTKTSTPVTCYGQSNGSACVTASGGTPAYTYTWTNGGSASCITGVAAGIYGATVTDANGCSVAINDTVTQPDSIHVSIVLYGNDNCIKLDANQGYVAATVTGGTAPYTYEWKGNPDSSAPSATHKFNFRDSTRNTITGLAAGIYSLTVTDANGCSVVIIGDLVCPTCPIPVDTVHISGPPAICEGGSVTLSVDSATAIVTGYPSIEAIEWFGPSSDVVPISFDKSISTSTPGAYFVDVFYLIEKLQDTSYCASTGTDTLKGDTLNISPSSKNPTCYGLCNGSISVSVSGGYTPYTIVWDSSKVSGFTPTGLCAGNYAFTVTDANGCTTNGLITLEAPPLLTITKTTTNVTCYNGDNGSACVTASGGTPAYTYSWSTGGTGSCVTGLGAGYVTVTVTDAYGCSVSQTDTITQPTKLVVTKSSTPVTCYGYDNGSACVTASGGTPAYTYSWSTGGSGNCITGVAAGIYDATVTDANGCSVTIIDTINQPTKLTVTKTTVNVSCYGGANGSACVTASGGTPAYTYSWSNGGTNSCIREQFAGIYDATVTDANGCSVTIIDTINQPTQLTVTTSTTPVPCYGGTGSACVTASGGTPAYTYSWSTGGSGSCITGVAAGIYGATITDANGCSTTASDTITQPDSLSITVYPASPSCYNTCDGNALVVVSGGTQIPGESPYTIVWDSSDISGFAPTNLCGGTYCFTVTDANGCTDAQCFVIVPPDTLKAPYTFTNPTCYNTCNGTINVSPTGGTTYGDGAAYSIVWNFPYLNGQLNVTGLCGDSTYCFTVTDQNGCSKTGCVQLVRPDTLKVNVTKTNLTCNELNGLCDGTINVNVSGGTSPYTITWGDNLYGSTSFNQTSLCPDQYCYTVTDANGCSMSGCDSITQPPPFLLSSNCCPDQITCHNACNGKITVTVFGGVAPFTYSWSGPAGFVSSDTDYVNNLCPGIYTVTVTDANGCSYDDTHAPLINPDSIVGNLTYVNCNNGSCNGTASVSPSGGTPAYTYSWSTSSTASSVANLCSGTYTVTITDALGCSIIDTVTITCSCPSITNTYVNPTCYNSCNGSIAIHISKPIPEGLSIAWNGPNGSGTTTDTLLSGLCTGGQYCYTVTFTNGCSTSACVTINQPSKLTVTKTSVNATCQRSNGSACVTASGGTPAYTYSWNTGSTNNCITEVSGGIYTATVTDANGCSVSIIDTVTQTSMLTVTKTTTDVSCYGGTGSACITASGGSGVYTYTWNTGGSSTCITGVAAGIYHATVTDGTGCSATVNDTITQPDSLHLTVTTKNAGCNGVCNGSATIVATGGTSPYTIVWDSSRATGFNPTNLCGGTYCFTVSDVNRCTVSRCITISQTTLSVSVQSSNGTCYTSNRMCGGNPCSGTITLTITGANTYTVKWKGPNGFSSEGASLTGLCGGQYCYTVTAGSCIETGCVTITQPSPLTIKVTGTNNSCGNTCTGTATVTVSTGDAPYTYSWSNGSTTATITGLCATTYTVTVTSSEGCTTSGSICITKPTPLTISICKQDASCSGTCNGSASVTVCGGNAPYTYTWSNKSKSSSICNLCSGQYCVTVTSASGCSATGCVTINQPAGITLKLCSTNVTCNGSMNGTAGVTVTGGTGPFSYHWSNGACQSSICNLCAGCYCVTVTSCGGCSASGCVTITQPNPLCVSVTTSSATCSGGCNGSASVSASGGNGSYSYAWSNGGNGSCDKDLCPGSYSVTVSSAGCCVTKCFTICGPSASIKVCVSGTNPSNGNNGEACVSSVSGGTAPYCYSWSDGKTACCITCLPAGCYCVTVYDANRCSATACVTLKQQSSCGGRSEDGDGSASASVTVSDPQINVYPNPFTSYTNIDFILPNDDNVTLEVYSITGVKVAELYKGSVQGGIKNSVRFTNDNLSESMYIYRLVTTDKAMTGNLIIVR